MYMKCQRSSVGLYDSDTGLILDLAPWLDLSKDFIQMLTLTLFMLTIAFDPATWISPVISLRFGHPMPWQWHFDLPIHLLCEWPHLWNTIDRLWLSYLDLYRLADREMRWVLQSNQIWGHCDAALWQGYVSVHFSDDLAHHAWLRYRLYRPCKYLKSCQTPQKGYITSLTLCSSTLYSSKHCSHRP